MTGKISYCLNGSEIKLFQERLLSWYIDNKRDLPWRRAASNTDRQQHAYAVWVSEIMLQQTRVATVIDYYTRWMEKWPTVRALSEATLDEVNEAWAGLGYYSRGRRLREGTVKIMKELNGKLPETSAGLIKQIPGVGKYTAAAISSIAFGESVGVLDGNVIRVLCRLLTIGDDSSSKPVLDHLWKQVDNFVPSDTPGDFNQAMMELGALVCTPKSPQCSVCPVRPLCRAYAETEDYKNKNSVLKSGKNKNKKLDVQNTDVAVKEIKTEENLDIESCADHLSFPPGSHWIPDLGVMNYPRKAEKKAPRQETALISVVEMKDEKGANKFLINQRPKSGLLAGLWEFPTSMLSSEEINDKKFQRIFGEENKLKLSEKYFSEKMDPMLDGKLQGLQILNRTYKGEMTHIFSHIHLRYIVEHVSLGLSENSIKTGEPGEGLDPKWKWVSENDLQTCAMSSAMHKILKLSRQGKTGKNKAKLSKNQSKLEAFFQPKAKKAKLDSVSIKNES